GQPYTPKKNQPHQIVKHLSDTPSKKAANGFYKRTGFRLNRSKSIENNMLRYSSYIKKNDKKTVIFNSLARFAFFSRNKVTGLVCLTRHPLHAYLSFSKKNRHFSLIEKLGGINNKRAITYYSNMWNYNIDEYLSLTKWGSKIIRFEHFREDICFVPQLKFMIKKWRGDRRNKNILSNEATDLLKKKTQGNFYRIYSQWDM
ncbi:MAG: hypothetical protein ACOC56_03225, partial [Atribacterota bacterium]